MARVTIEDCLKNIDNRFALVHLTSSRVRQIKKGSHRLVYCKNKDIVAALREIAAGYVRADMVAPIADVATPIKLEAPTA